MNKYREVNIPRYVPEGVRNYNGVLLDPDSLNKKMGKYINSGQCFVYDYIPSDEHTSKPGGFYLNDCTKIVGLVKSYDKENITVNLDKNIEYKNPVALITTMGELEDDNVYKITGFVRIEIVEEDNLDRPRIKLENK